MKVTLIKKNKKTTDIVQLENEDHLLLRKEGKIGKPFTFSSTSNRGTAPEAMEAINKIVAEFQLKGYEVVDSLDVRMEKEVFDKAKWHLNKEFPADLDSYQAYVHTGFYIGWLIRKDLISKEFKDECHEEIEQFLRKEKTGVSIYADQLDGVFSSDETNETGFKFTMFYFDFDKGKYLQDYEKYLAKKLPTLFHVEDTWVNFEIINAEIEKRFLHWLDVNN